MYLTLASCALSTTWIFWAWTHSAHRRSVPAKWTRLRGASMTAVLRWIILLSLGTGALAATFFRPLDTLAELNPSSGAITRLAPVLAIFLRSRLRAGFPTADLKPIEGQSVPRRATSARAVAQERPIQSGPKPAPTGSTMQISSPMNSENTAAGARPHIPHCHPRPLDLSGSQTKPGRPPIRCVDCGTEIHSQATVCAICERRQNHRPAAGRRVFVDWLLLLGIMSAIFGLGHILAN
ncbi:hypothetical protein OEZ60_11375 [Defluviimonas sp. WL0024]|uniref:Zinc ribbon domain-containing protein n=1 Tax=Albidovulum salinarum TaxID=2984153 RepID=A0ABT2X3T8_9RHOB|nr:hypothetical protein [Defluviimonas sp. WL0024]MCU9848612.1 hypothetical protein [Defluviimonas sp. WL0024]